nr:hypothetical protein [Tanacetum cinerariifolium]
NELKHDEKASTSYESSQEIESLKHTLSEYLKENESLEQKITILKDDFRKEESRNIDRELALDKEAQQLKLNLYDGSVIGKSDVIVVPDSENTLLHAEESRSKMIAKQNDPQLIEKKVITKPIDYATLNKLSTDFHTRFVPQTESYAEQAFWSQYSVQTDEPTHSGTTIVEVPKELPKVSMVNPCLKKLKYHLASFDVVVKERTTATAITEVSEVQKIFKQMEMAVEQNCTAKTKFQSKMESVFKENDHLLKHALGVDIVNIVVKDCMNVKCLTVDACEQCVTTESELKTDFIKKENYEMLLKKVTKLTAKNNHLKQTYKQLFNSIKSSRVQSKEQCDDLINQVNLKSVEVTDLNTSLQEKVLVITALKEQLKGKA